MKIRKHKHLVLARMAHNRMLQDHIDRLMDLVMAERPGERLARGIWFEKLWSDLFPGVGATPTMEQPAAAAVQDLELDNICAAAVKVAKQEFVVVKKSTGEVVDTFDQRNDAVALIEKHKRQKKATLMLLDTAAA